MKKMIVFSTALFLSILSNATIHYVNNTPGQDADFTSLPAAITAATAGDTIYVQPSLTSYGDITINKQLFIIGAGHKPEFSAYSSTVGGITFVSGSDGTFLKSLKSAGIFGAMWNTSNNVVVSGCLVIAQNPTSFNQGTWNNWTFEGNIFSSQTNGINLGSFGSNMIFRNNIFHTFAGSNIVGYCQPGYLFENNIFMCTDNSNFNAALSNSNGVILRNNIFYTTTSTGNNVANGCSSCTWENNVTYNPNLEFTDLPGTGNLDNTNPDFVSVPLLNIAFDYSKDYHLNPTSPLVNAATDGGDIGIYGGIYNFRKEGFDNTLPRIKSVTVLSATSPPGGVLQINLKAAAAGN